MNLKLTTTLLVFLMVVGSTFQGKAQKLGHVKLQKVLKAMPDHDSARQRMQEFQKRLQSNIKQMNAEYQSKVTDFQQRQEKMTDTERENMMSNIQDLQKRIQKAQSQAQKDIRKQEQELIQPLIKKVQKAIDKVAEENGYTYIFNSTSNENSMGGGLLLYEGGKDVTKKVKKEMGLMGNK
ncbi:MAG: OmpH family outer membrane protein [Flavobacteriales bacterium]